MKGQFFKAEFNRFEFRVFLLLDWLPHQSWKPSLPYYLRIAGGRIIGFIPFSRLLVLYEMQSVSSRIWTRVAVSISYDDYIYQPLRSGRMWHKVNFFKRCFTGLNSEFSFSQTSWLTKAEESSLPYYLPIAEGRIIGFIPFSRLLVLCEMQSVASTIWTRVAVSISYDYNHCTTGTSTLLPYNCTNSLNKMGILDII